MYNQGYMITFVHAYCDTFVTTINTTNFKTIHSLVKVYLGTKAIVNYTLGVSILFVIYIDTLFL